MIKIGSFRIWGEQITVTNRRVDVLTIMHYDEKWYCIDRNAGVTEKDREDIYNHCKGIGNQIYCIDSCLYFDSDAYFNIDLMFNNYDFIDA